MAQTLDEARAEVLRGFEEAMGKIERELGLGNGHGTKDASPLCVCRARWPT
jgi:hypothetical protein